MTNNIGHGKLVIAGGRRQLALDRIFQGILKLWNINTNMMFLFPLLVLILALLFTIHKYRHEILVGATIEVSFGI